MDKRRARRLDLNGDREGVGADLEEAEEERLWEETGKDENKGEPHRRELQR